MIPKVEKTTEGPGAVIDNKETKLDLDQKRKAIQPKTLALLQEQIRHELFAERLYYSIAAWADWKGYPQTGKWFSEHAEEEHEHAMRFVNFIQKRGEHARFPDTEIPVQDFEDMKGVINTALKHEYFITDRIANIYNTACDEGDVLAKEFAREFIAEQIEEEQLFLSMKKWLDVMGGTPSPDWELEIESIHKGKKHIVGKL